MRQNLLVFHIISLLLLLLIKIPSQGQVNRTYDLMPVPQQLKINGLHLTITNKFSVSIIGNPALRIYGEASRFIRRLSKKRVSSWTNRAL